MPRSRQGQYLPPLGLESGARFLGPVILHTVDAQIPAAGAQRQVDGPFVQEPISQWAELMLAQSTPQLVERGIQRKEVRHVGRRQQAIQGGVDEGDAAQPLRGDRVFQPLERTDFDAIIVVVGAG